MKYKYSFGRVANAIVMALVVLCVSPDVFANLEGKWIYHPAATLRSISKEGQVDRIIDGNRYVYFSVRGSAFDRSKGYLYTSPDFLDKDPLQLFRYDKTTPWEEGCIKPISADMDLSGAMHSALAYSPRLGVLAVVYENHTIDFIFDDGNLVSSFALRDAVMPSNAFEAFSITFDEDFPYAYIATNSGYAVVNCLSGELEKNVSLDKAVSWAGRVGDNMVVFAGSFDYKTYSTQTYVFPKDAAPATLDSPVAGGADLQALMPLNSNSFAALAPASTAQTANIVRVFTVGSDGQVSNFDAVPSTTVDNGSSTSFRHLFRTDGFVSPTRDGYAFSHNGAIEILKKGVPFSGEADFKANAMTSISKGALADANEKNAKAATSDGSTVWFYSYSSTGLDQSKRGFYKRAYNGSGWDDRSEVVTPHGPMTAYTFFMKWHPEYGMLFKGPGTVFNAGCEEREYFFSYKDGKWTDLSLAANNSKYLASSLYPNHLDIDSENPDWVWYNAPKSGLIRLSLSDPSNYLNLGSNAPSLASWATTYPGFTPIFPYQSNRSSSNHSFTSLSNVDFDNEGRMWFGRFWVISGVDFDYEDLTVPTVPLYYLTAEERLSMKGNGLDGAIPAPHKIEIPRAYSYHTAQTLALKNEKNSNIIVYSPIHFIHTAYRPFLLDHKGTPEDTSDDSLIYIEGLFDDNGEKINFARITRLFEDVKTGDLWICTDTGPILINPSDILEGRMTARKPRITRKYGMECDDYPFEQIAVTAISEDFLGRKWLSSEQGLFCLSADGTELLGHYNTENSPLANDFITSMECDGSTGALFMMTDRGLYEFQPEGSLTAVAAGTSLSVWPSAVNPAYNGYVSVSGAENGSEHVVCDKDGNVIASLGTPSDGKLQWDATGDDGQRVKPGRYSIKRRNVEESNPVIILE